MRWHRAGRHYWRWKSRSLGARPHIEADLRALIRRMSIENQLWGAPRIHGELLKIGFEIAQSSVAKYMAKRRDRQARSGAHSCVIMPQISTPWTCLLLSDAERATLGKIGLGVLRPHPSVCCDVDPDEASTVQPNDNECIEQIEANGRNTSAAFQLGLQDAIFGGQIFVPRQQLLVHHPRDEGQDARPIPISVCAMTVSGSCTVWENLSLWPLPGGYEQPPPPDVLTPAERLDEIAEILAAGLMRLRARQSSRLSADCGESSLDFSPDQSGHANVLRETEARSDRYRAGPAGGAEDACRSPDLKQQWRDLFDTEPPPYNRRFLESRLAYRIQELAYGGLKPETIERLEALAEQLDGGKIGAHAAERTDRPDRRHPADPRMAGRRALRHGARRRLRVSGPALQIALRRRPRHHRHALERLGVLRPEEPAGAA